MRVLIVDDHEIVRQGVRSLLAGQAGIEVCGEAVDGRDAVAKAQRLGPDLITMDVSMPNMDGLEATRQIRRLRPNAQVLILSQHDVPEMVTQAMEAGASGYVVKSTIAANLAAAIQALRGGGTFFEASHFRAPSEAKALDTHEVLQRSAAFENALRQTQQRLGHLLDYNQALLNNMAEGLYIIDTDGRLTCMNPAAEAMFGWTESELLGKKMHDVTHYKHVDGSPFPGGDCPCLQVLERDAELREHEDFFIRKDGTFFPVVFTASPLRAAGTLAGVIVGFRDDTVQRGEREALHRAKRELEITASHLQLVTDSMAIGVTRCSRELRYLWANRSYSLWMGVPLSEIADHSIEEVLGSEAFSELSPRFQQVLAGERIAFEQEVHYKQIGLRRISATYTPTLGADGVADGWVAVVDDVTEQKRTESALRRNEAALLNHRADLEEEVVIRNSELQQVSDELRELNARLLQAQDEERRRIARELHDGAGQLLAALSLNNSIVAAERSHLSPTASRCVEETAALTEQLSNEIRTMSYLLHPPLLDALGLKSALEDYVRGFQERSKIGVTLEVPAQLERLPQALELSLFRVVQEGLTNIHRHSGSSTASVRLALLSDSAEIALQIADKGCGLSREQQAQLLAGRSSGVGLRGMRERIRQLGGSLQVDSPGRGTTVKVILPLHPRSTMHKSKNKPAADMASAVDRSLPGNNQRAPDLARTPRS